ncbi:MAG TPA: CoA transferase [Gemmatimonadaceae bacterium]|nr:CoA transferase [Gemmatimonadaceae bacterium]
MLHGINVLDLTRVLAGPVCTMALGDMGANVVKIERPGGGDETRGWGPPFDARGESAYFLSVNRNKLSVTAHLQDDRALLLQLLDGADVVVENFRPGTLERSDLGARQMLDRYPRLVWCTITGFGVESTRPGYDAVVQAERGWMSITGHADGPPTKVGVALADVIAGKDAAIGILAALVARDRQPTPLTARDRHIVVSLARSAAAALVNVAQSALVTGRDAVRWGNAHPSLVPYQAFAAADRDMVVAVGSDAQWRACALALGLAELAADPVLATNAGRVRERERVVGAIQTRLRERPAEEWLRALDRAGVPCGLVKTVLEAVREEGGSPLTGIPPAVPGRVRYPPPRLDEHGALVRAHGWNAFAQLPVQADAAP